MLELLLVLFLRHVHHDDLEEVDLDQSPTAGVGDVLDSEPENGVVTRVLPLEISEHAFSDEHEVTVLRQVVLQVPPGIIQLIRVESLRLLVVALFIGESLVHNQQMLVGYLHRPGGFIGAEYFESIVLDDVVVLCPLRKPLH